MLRNLLNSLLEPISKFVGGFNWILTSDADWILTLDWILTSDAS
jgi:hypothetical protein